MKNYVGDVFFVVQLPTPLRFAPAQRIYSFCKQLIRNGYNVHIIGGVDLVEIMSKKSGIPFATTMFHELNISYYVIEKFSNPLIRFVNMMLAFFQSLYIIISKPRIVVVSLPPSDLVLATYIASRLIDAIYIVDMRDPDEEYLVHTARSTIGKVLAKLLRKINYSIYKQSELVIFATHRMREMLRAYGINGIVIPNGADLNIFKPRVTRERFDDRLILLFVGKTGSYYKLDTLIFALKLLDLAGYRISLWVVGTIDKGAQSLIRKVNADKIVEYLGIKSPREVASNIMPLADIGVIPRINDPLYDYAIPAKFYEYIASGLPVFALCKKGSELAEIIAKYDIGWVCEWNDVECIVKTLKHVYLNRDELIKKRENALKLRPQIDRNRSSLAFLKVLEKLMKIY